MELDDCVVVKKNLGKGKCDKLPNMPKCMITTPTNWFIAPADYATLALLKVKLQALLTNPINSRGYLWPLFASSEDQSTEAQYEDTPLGRHPLNDGQYRFKFGIRKNLCIHKAMFTHRAINEGRVIVIDTDNQLNGTFDADGNFMGFSIGLVHTEKLQLSNGSVSTKSPVIVDLADNEEWDKDGGLLAAGTMINQLERLTDVSLELLAGDAFNNDEFYVTVKQSCDGVPVSGLVLADFLMYAADGITPQVIDSAAEDANNPGRYWIKSGAGAFANGSLTLRAPSALTVKAYEVEAALAIVGIV